MSRLASTTCIQKRRAHIDLGLRGSQVATGAWGPAIKINGRKASRFRESSITTYRVEVATGIQNPIRENIRKEAINSVGAITLFLVEPVSWWQITQKLCIIRCGEPLVANAPEEAKELTAANASSM
ncbi:uncharacterized protein G2W53_027167 [Senna tora]|uniref:Uncharacterized protein n=1 Tax=Senna tora TaxID=362788 RepID=A0A834TGF1_9FABA|nr:uncharacterized protein G2W53_027167 [Senna tora]